MREYYSKDLHPASRSASRVFKGGPLSDGLGLPSPRCTLTASASTAWSSGSTSPNLMQPLGVRARASRPGQSRRQRGRSLEHAGEVKPRRYSPDTELLSGSRACFSWCDPRHRDDQRAANARGQNRSCSRTVDLVPADFHGPAHRGRPTLSTAMLRGSCPRNWSRRQRRIRAFASSERFELLTSLTRRCSTACT